MDSFEVLKTPTNLLHWLPDYIYFQLNEFIPLRTLFVHRKKHINLSIHLFIIVTAVLRRPFVTHRSFQEHSSLFASSLCSKEKKSFGKLQYPCFDLIVLPFKRNIMDKWFCLKIIVEFHNCLAEYNYKSVKWPSWSRYLGLCQFRSYFVVNRHIRKLKLYCIYGVRGARLDGYAETGKFGSKFC